MLKRLKPWLDMALMTDDEEAGGAGGVLAYPEQGKGHFFLQCWRGSSASESECRRRRLLWGYLLLMTRKLTTESGAGLACSTYHVAYASCVCVCAVVLLKCFQISRISGQQRQQNDAGSLLTFRCLFVRQIVQRFSSSFFLFCCFSSFFGFSSPTSSDAPHKWALKFA